MLRFKIESWGAIAPGLESREEWMQWLKHPLPINQPLGKPPLKAVPAMIRRRFNTLGRCAMAAVMPLVEQESAMPSIFASRHGDTELTFALLETMGRGEPMSPTNFSLAVHNAVCGLFTIARKDTSETTAIAAMQGLIMQTFFEAAGQLQSVDRLLCVIYDIPLPDFYQQHCEDETDRFPYAIAMVLGRGSGATYKLEQVEDLERNSHSLPTGFDSEPLQLVGLLAGEFNDVVLAQSGNLWRLARVTD